MSWNGFQNLNLSGVEPEQGRRTLEPGKYTCKITDVEVSQNAKRTGFVLKVELTDIGGAGAVTDNINVSNSNPEAERIGLGRLKALLTAGGHPNPDRPGDVSSLKGLTVGVHVEQSEDYVDKDGKLRKGGGKPRRSGAYFKPEVLTVVGGVGVVGTGHAAPRYSAMSTAPVDDEIPF